MQMTFRWYGEGNDSITPEMIKQIPGVTGLVWALHDKQAGEVWTVEEIEEARRQIEGAGFNMDVVESVNVHDDIHTGVGDNNGMFGLKIASRKFTVCSPEAADIRL